MHFFSSYVFSKDSFVTLSYDCIEKKTKWIQIRVSFIHGQTVAWSPGTSQRYRTLRSSPQTDIIKNSKSHLPEKSTMVRYEPLSHGQNAVPRWSDNRGSTVVALKSWISLVFLQFINRSGSGSANQVWTRGVWM